MYHLGKGLVFNSAFHNQNTGYISHEDMEKSLEKQIDDIRSIPGVSGVLCCDAGGLCLTAKGVANKESAGHIASISSQAEKLHPEIGCNPVVCIESEGGTIMIKKEENVTMAIYKTSV